MLKLYDFPRSGNAYKARLMLGLLGLDYERITVDLANKKQLEPWYLAINPLHLVPVLDDDGVIIRDSAAVLVYLAAKFDTARTWYPADARGAAEVQQWLAFASGEIANTLLPVRAIGLGLRPGDLVAVQEVANRTLSFMGGQLAGRDWLAGTRPTIADVACYSYVGLLGQGKMDINAYPALAAWEKRLAALKGYQRPPAPPDWK